MTSLFLASIVREPPGMTRLLPICLKDNEIFGNEENVIVKQSTSANNRAGILWGGGGRTLVNEIEKSMVSPELTRSSHALILAKMCFWFRLDCLIFFYCFSDCLTNSSFHHCGGLFLISETPLSSCTNSPIVCEPCNMSSPVEPRTSAFGSLQSHQSLWSVLRLSHLECALLMKFCSWRFPWIFPWSFISELFAVLLVITHVSLANKRTNLDANLVKWLRCYLTVWFWV